MSDKATSKAASQMLEVMECNGPPMPNEYVATGNDAKKKKEVNVHELDHANEFTANAATASSRQAPGAGTPSISDSHDVDQEAESPAFLQGIAYVVPASHHQQEVVSPVPICDAVPLPSSTEIVHRIQIVPEGQQESCWKRNGLALAITAFLVFGALMATIGVLVGQQKSSNVDGTSFVSSSEEHRPLRSTSTMSPVPVESTVSFTETTWIDNSSGSSLSSSTLETKSTASGSIPDSSSPAKSFSGSTSTTSSTASITATSQSASNSVSSSSSQTNSTLNSETTTTKTSPSTIDSTHLQSTTTTTSTQPGASSTTTSAQKFTTTEPKTEPTHSNLGSSSTASSAKTTTTTSNSTSNGHSHLSSTSTLAEDSEYHSTSAVSPQLCVRFIGALFERDCSNVCYPHSAIDGATAVVSKDYESVQFFNNLELEKTIYTEYNVWDVALSGDVAVAGAPEEEDYTGAAFVFERNSLGVWEQTQRLAPTGIIGQKSYFGYAVAIHDDVIVVGAPILLGRRRKWRICICVSALRGKLDSRIGTESIRSNPRVWPISICSRKYSCGRRLESCLRFQL